MKKFSFKSAPRTQILSVDQRVTREQMLRAVPEELLAQIRGGFAEGCHPMGCTCCGGCGGGTALA
jgi:hypothetical protein